MTRAGARAVLVAPIAPARDGNGLAMRAGVALDALAIDHAVDLVVVPVAGGPPPGDWARERARRVAVLPPDAAVGDAVAAVGGEPADVVYVVRLYLALFATPWFGRSGCVVLDRDEDDAAVHRQLAALHRPSDPTRAGELDHQARRFEAFASEWASRFDLVLTTDDVPNPTPPLVADDTHVPPIDIVFAGNLSYGPNIAAVERLCTRIVPRITDALGRPARLAVVGSSPNARLDALVAAVDGTVVADPASVSPWYRAAAVAAVPIDAGGGTRLKVLEAFAHEVPVVATSIGIAGIPATPDVDVLVADDDESFADACVTIIRRPEIGAALSTHARSIAVAHEWDRVVDHLRDRVQTAAERALRSPG